MPGDNLDVNGSSVCPVQNQAKINETYYKGEKGDLAALLSDEKIKKHIPLIKPHYKRDPITKDGFYVCSIGFIDRKVKDRPYILCIDHEKVFRVLQSGIVD